jgi:hypothetical protein
MSTPQHRQHSLRGSPRGLSLLLLFITLLLTFLAVFVHGQVTSIVGDLWRERTVKYGDRFVEKIGVNNPTKNPLAVTFTQYDISESLGQISTVPAGKCLRSNSSWMKLPFVTYVIPPERMATISMPVVVPWSCAPGTYYSAIQVATSTPKVEKGIGATISPAVVIQFVHTIPGGRKEVKLSKAVCTDKGELVLDLKNTGDEVLIFDVTGKDIATRMRIYPGETQRKTIDVKAIPDGQVRRRLILDDGISFLIPLEIEFKKGRSDERPLSYIGGQRYRKLGSLSLVLDYGNRIKGLRVLGSLNVGKFSVTASGSRNEFANMFNDGYQILASYRTPHLTLGAGRMWYSGREFTTVNGAVYLRPLSLSVTYAPEFKMATGFASLALWSKMQVSVYGNYRNGRMGDWVASAIWTIF